jgi:hypothetical protein
MEEESEARLCDPVSWCMQHKQAEACRRVDLREDALAIFEVVKRKQTRSFDQVPEEFLSKRVGSYACWRDEAGGGGWSSQPGGEFGKERCRVQSPRCAVGKGA